VNNTTPNPLVAFLVYCLVALALMAGTLLILARH